MARALASPLLPGLRGAIGDLVISQLPDGPVVRRRGIVRVPPTAAKAAGMGRMTLVSRAWAMLPPEVVERWRRYARGQAVRNPATGAIVAPRAYNEFCRLAGKARQVDAGFDLSNFGPPERAFTGDGVVVEVTGNALPLPLPPLQDNPLGEGVLRFSADRANGPGVVTELLVQPLVNAYRRSYADRYASAGFHAFAGPGEVVVPVKAGAVAVAYQFVVPATGQEGALVELGTFLAG